MGPGRYLTILPSRERRGRERMVGYSNIINKKSSTTIPKDSFVAPSPSCNHSMLHQTFYPPLFRYPKSLSPFSAASSLLPPPSPPPSSLPEVERNPSSMEAGAAAAALQETRLPAAPPALEELEPELVLPDDVNWAVEHATMMDEFLVDDLLLDFDETEVEEIKQENTFEADTPTAAVTPAATTAEIFEPAPLSGMDFWSHNPEEFEWMSSIIDESMAEYPPSAAVPTFIPTTQKWLPAVKRAKRSEGLRIPCSSWPCPFTKSDSSGSSNTTVSTSSSSSSQYNTHNFFKYGNYQFDQQLSKKRGRKPKNHQLPRPAYPAAAGRAGGSSYGERSCTHCGSQKTPQWRLGPMGPKTLCNACGVRYKSGRLVPEYRPAASPTFIPQVHSSSHRKVMEMRRQKEMEAVAPPPRAASC